MEFRNIFKEPDPLKSFLLLGKRMTYEQYKEELHRVINCYEIGLPGNLNTVALSLIRINQLLDFDLQMPEAYRISRNPPKSKVVVDLDEFEIRERECELGIGITEAEPGIIECIYIRSLKDLEDDYPRIREIKLLYNALISEGNVGIKKLQRLFAALKNIRGSIDKRSDLVVEQQVLDELDRILTLFREIMVQKTGSDETSNNQQVGNVLKKLKNQKKLGNREELLKIFIKYKNVVFLAKNLKTISQIWVLVKETGDDSLEAVHELTELLKARGVTDPRKYLEGAEQIKKEKLEEKGRRVREILNKIDGCGGDILHIKLELNAEYDFIFNNSTAKELQELLVLIGPFIGNKEILKFYEDFERKLEALLEP